MDSALDRAFDRRAMLGLAIAAGLSLPACGRSAPPGTSTPTTLADRDAIAIATDAYIFGLPLLLVHATRDAAGPVNIFQHADYLPSADDRLVVRLNLDTLYSMAWLDLAAEPMILQVPSVPGGRYWLMQLLDAWTNTVHDPSAPRPGTANPQGPYTYLITGPGWTGEVPAGVTRLPMPTHTAWLTGRIQINGRADLPAVHAVQQELRLAPLPAWLADPHAPTPGLPLPARSLGAGPGKDVAAMDGRTFYDRLCALMAVDAPAPADAPALKRFAAIGIEPGGAVAHYPGATLATAAAAGRRRIADYVNPDARTVNGWRIATDLGSYGTDYLFRAGTAATALGVNLPRDALYPTTQAVADDNGAPRRFRLRFAPGQLPPVDAFWSVTAYDADSYLVANPAHIYAVGHEIPVVPGPDGSVEIAVQNADPGPAVPRGNWLPIPGSGKFSLTMRLYAPRSDAIEGLWQPPELKPVS
ncbi:DUF1254 domain-containing protein [Nocardia sp. NPDC020380]|uniref:DUF1254 domain-containing protein n=1 Tax=Nocardia sp. NPDC020380 TaxID=3364309 RepID=UPI0037AE2C90